MTSSERINRQRGRDALLARKTAFDALLADLQRMSDGQFGADPDAVLWDQSEATGLQPHTVRGFLAGLKRRGFTAAVLERARQVGSDRQGARDSCSIRRTPPDATLAGAG